MAAEFVARPRVGDRGDRAAGAQHVLDRVECVAAHVVEDDVDTAPAGQLHHALDGAADGGVRAEGIEDGVRQRRAGAADQQHQHQAGVVGQAFEQA